MINRPSLSLMPIQFTPVLFQSITSFKDRAEGVRVKHWVRGNSIKLYDMAGSLLRTETTIGTARS